MKDRELFIRREKEDPFRYGWEPPIWRVCDAFLGFDWVDPKTSRGLRNYLEKDMLSKFEQWVVQLLLIQGGNRGSKSEYAAKRVMKVLLGKKNARAWCFHTNNPNSVEYQQPLLWRYLPKEFQRKIKSEVGYISYNQKYGFSDNKFVLPNGSECIFRNYEQDMDTIEGGEVDIIWFDELVPPDWVDTARLRIATRHGRIIITFTPVKGYTQTVKMFVDGAQPVIENPAFLCPKDGKESLEEQALILEKCDTWAKGERELPEIPAGRVLDKVPRVIQPPEPNARVVYFHSSDNPYGNPSQVLDLISGKSTAFIKERFYGIADKTMSSRFPKFRMKIHVVKPEDIPESGTNYHFVDPASGRNFFMSWFRVTPEGVYLYREWPGNYHIPEQGVPGPWALPDGKKLDGKKGPAQDPFGFGLLQYKNEIARLERWKDAKQEKKQDVTKSEFIKGWTEHSGSEEIIFERFMDSRFASAPKLEKDRPTSLLEKFAEIHLHFNTTPGNDINEGVQMITDALDYDEEKEIDFFNKPNFYVSSDCKNTIYALQNWTGQDGTRGACKDPIDNLRYFWLADCSFIDKQSFQSHGGGHY